MLYLLSNTYYTNFQCFFLSLGQCGEPGNKNIFSKYLSYNIVKTAYTKKNKKKKIINQNA